MRGWVDLAEEVVVVDSRSTDGTVEYIRQELAHPRLRIIERDRGLYASWNEGIAATTGAWIYVSTAGDTIDREQVRHLVETGERAEADVVISPPRFVDSEGDPIADLAWPPHAIIARHGDGRPFILSPTALATLAYLHCPNSILGSSASNVYRGETLRARPFPTDFRGAGDTVWLMRHSLSVRACLTPRAGSAFCGHPKEDKMTVAEADAFRLKLSEEKDALARRVREAAFSAEPAMLEQLTVLQARKRELLLRRRERWHSAKPGPLAVARWLWDTVNYGWRSAEAGRGHRDVLRSLTAPAHDGHAHFRPLD